MSWLAGVDVGGTFTDIVLVNTASNEIRIGKVPTSAMNQADSFLRALVENCPLAEVDAIVHGTTVGTNAILERKGARTGLITSQGFRDIIELGRRTRPHNFGLTGEFFPLIAREHRQEVAERLSANGAKVIPLDKAGVARAVRALLDDGVESVAVMFMHSYSDPSNELAAAKIIGDLWPNEYISLSHRVLPEAGEFERVSTTAINAYLQPLLHRYVTRVEEQLKEAGYQRVFRVMQSNGGALNPANASRAACRSVVSGPAGGAIATAWIAEHLGIKQAVSADMGGTSFDVSVILDGHPSIAEEKELDYGMPLRIPIIDIETIGAGGGSLIYVDEVGMLHVGPESAGAEPGPISYGLGGTRPTVTDANVLLGRLDVANVVGKSGVDITAVRAALTEIGKQLGTSPEGAAEAAIRVADLNMANAIRRLTLEKGHDTRQFVLLPFGGAGPLHACAIADNLSITKILLPIWPGVTSALGCLLADIRYDDTWSVYERLDAIRSDRVQARYAEMVERVMAVMREDGAKDDQIELRYEAALQYEGQTHRIIVSVPNPKIDGAQFAELFEREYRRRYGVTIDNIAVILVLLRVHASAPRNVGEIVERNLRRSFEARRAKASEHKRGKTKMMFGGQWLDALTCWRDDLRPGEMIAGPARMDQSDTTTVIPVGWSATVEDLGYITLTKHEGTS